ncbi:hypothetical protein KW792_01020 [Candidatus Saccharibacteria bacterium]|nr:hypothetical protein [Candidatus Saccharibacteria bacterium]
MKRFQKGFAPLETILIIVIVGLLAFVCWYVFTSTSDTNNAYENTANTQTNLPTASKDETSKTQTTQVVVTKTDAKLGDYLASTDGKALYTYTLDTANNSKCDSSCLAIWPVYKATSSTGTLPTDVAVMSRSDGTKQYTYKKLQIYYYTGDTAAGQVTGDGVNGFRAAKP